MIGAQAHPSKKQITRGRTIVREIIAYHFGGTPSHTRYLEGGKTNFVFKVQHAGENYIVRINSDAAKLQSFLKEQWAVAKVKRLGVPTPEILEVGNEVSDWPYMISRQVVGFEATVNANRTKIIEAMGRHAAIINSVSTSGFGASFDWSKNKLSRNLTWSDFLENELELSQRLAFLEKERLISASTKKQLRSILENGQRLAGKACLNHGDLRLKNLLVDSDGKIVAIVDWEHSLSSSSAWELSVALHDLTIDEKEEFLDGYGISESAYKRLAPLVKAFNLINYVPSIENVKPSSKARYLKAHRLRLRGLLDLYSL